MADDDAATGKTSAQSFALAPSIFTLSAMPPALYIVATPIGNLRDMTLRALQTLANADLIACEDTRVTGKLLAHFAIKTRMIAYHDHNADRQSAPLIKALGEGKSIALVSDAGTPLISDPGYRLVVDVVEAGFDVVPIPGVSSPITALSAAGLPTDRLLFAGFLPPKQAARRTRLTEMKAIPATLAFLESPKRIASALQDCAAMLGGERRAVVARELTKMHETFYRGALSDLAAEFEAAPTPKGEIVLLIEPPGEQDLDPAAIDDLLLELLTDFRVKEVAEQASKKTGLPKRDLYQRALQLKAEADG